MSAKKVANKNQTIAKNPAPVAKKSHKLAIIIAIVAGVLLIGSVAFAATWALARNSCGANMTKDAAGDCVSNDQTKHNCPAGEVWGQIPLPNSNDWQCMNPNAVYKPIIYLYPTKTETVSVKVSNPQNFTAQYPAYGDGWTVVAQPNGDLTDTKTGRELYSLYYESKNIVPAKVEADGFVVKGADTADFLANILPKLGLNARESEEFIIYWLPILQQNPWNYIRFESLSEINANQELTISPTPDTLIRVMMSHKPLAKPISVMPQQIATPSRTGFTVVEWGGTEINGEVTK